jgi:hypothetical protein
MVYRRSSKRRSRGRNLVNRTLSESVSVVKNTSQKYMPKVKSGLETVGAKVTNTAKSSVPMLQQATRKFFSMFGIGKSKSRRHRRH